ncbi:MAG: T9SS type A sorting domain-containing protein [Flavobacteriales bacterium]
MKFSFIFFLTFLFSKFNLVFGQEVSTLTTYIDRRFEALHWHEDGRIYAIDYWNGSLYQLYLDGTIETVLSGYPALAGGGFDSSGNFYVSGANTGEIFRLNPDNSVLSVASGFLQPITLLEDLEDPDLFYITEYQDSKITKLTMSTGELTPFVSDNGLNGPDGIIHDWNGDLLVSNWENHKIHRVDQNGTVSLFTSLPELGNMGYITIVDEFLYVPSVSGNKVYRIDTNGQATVIAGTGLVGNLDGAGSIATFDDPNGICSNSTGDTLLVSSSNSVRMITNFSPINNIEEKTRAAFSLYPNPSSSSLKINVATSNSPLINWEIINNLGENIMCFKELTDTSLSGIYEIDISSLSSGNYIIQLFTSEGNPTTLSFIKE